MVKKLVLSKKLVPNKTYFNDTIKKILPNEIHNNYHWYLLESIGNNLVNSKLDEILSKKIKEKEYLFKKNKNLTPKEMLTVRKIVNRVIAVKIKMITKNFKQKSKSKVRFYLQRDNKIHKKVNIGSKLNFQST